MLLVNLMLVLTTTGYVSSVSSCGDNQFECILGNASSCVNITDRLIQCNCSEQNYRYCNTNSSCQAPNTYNDSLCWNISSIEDPTTALTESPTSGSNGNAYTHQKQVSLQLEGDCKTVNLEKFKQVVKNKTSQALGIQTEQVQHVTTECGSIIVNFSLHDNNNSALEVNIKTLQNLIETRALIFQFEGQSYHVMSSFLESVGSVTAAPQPTSMRTSTTGFHPLETNYKPIIISVAVGLAGFAVFVCCTCIVHSWWLKKNKFTDVNSTPVKDIEKKKQKEELREIRRQVKAEAEEKAKELEPASKFDMAFKKQPKVNERALANYDWARTSYLPGMLEPSRAEPNPAGSIPKLICDDDDDDELEPNEVGDDNNAIDSEPDSDAELEGLTSSTPTSSSHTPDTDPKEPIAEIPPPPPDDDYYAMMGRF